MSNALDDLRQTLTGICAREVMGAEKTADVIIAALPGLVKPLVWVRHPIGWNCEGFMIDARNFNAIYMMRGMHGKPRFDTVEAAKAAAQAHHVAQIMAAFGIDAGAMKEGKQ
ncbi:hypothetical protein [Sulfitobacter sp. PS-8MA]|uniref:hypothetical protein n=1 Tax=Sulfitobacter sp. PS-8MA TaxID=3237707 RepID=UPI0034C6A5C0